MNEEKLKKIIYELSEFCIEEFNTDPIVLSTAIEEFMSKVDNGEWTVTATYGPEKCWEGVKK
jgi:hypothetical protein